MQTVTEPNRMTEFEVQAYLWNALRQIGFNVRGEVKAKYAGRGSVRFDLAVFEDGKLAGIIEVKATKIRHRISWEATRQGYRYNQFGVPVQIVYGYEEAQDLVMQAKTVGLFAGRLTVAANG